MGKHDDLTPVYKKLAKKNEQENEGCEGFWAEAEVIHNGRTYWVTYTLRRENLGRSFSYDEEPFGEVRTTLTISDFQVTDANDNLVTTNFDPYEVETMFNDQYNRQ